MDPITLIGVLGAALLLAAFIASALNVMENEDLWYNVLNFVGAALLTWYAVLINSWPFIVIEAVWAVVALRGMWKKLAPGAKTS
ncbi:MAG: hypothetical protein AAB440_00200 [Patescibacteria group bacterium]